MTDKRRRYGRLIVPALVIAAIVLALLYAQCQGGLGLGGGSEPGVDEPPAPRAVAAPVTADAAPARCQLRLDGAGLAIDGTVAAAETASADAVAACRAAGAADVVVTGEARQGAWDDLRAALDAAGIASFVRGAGAPPVTPDAAP